LDIIIGYLRDIEIREPKVDENYTIKLTELDGSHYGTRSEIKIPAKTYAALEQAIVEKWLEKEQDPAINIARSEEKVNARIIVLSEESYQECMNGVKIALEHYNKQLSEAHKMGIPPMIAYWRDKVDSMAAVKFHLAGADKG